MSAGKWMRKSRQNLAVLGKAVRLSWDCSPRWTWINLGLICLQSFAPLAVFYFTKLSLDAVSAALRSPEKTRYELIVRWVVLAAVASWITQVLRSLSTYAGEMQSELVSEHVQELIARKACRLDLAYYENPAYVDTLHQTQHEAPYRPARVILVLAQVTQSALSLVALGAMVLFYLHWPLLLAIAAFGLLGLLSRLHNVRLLFRWRTTKASQERQLSYYNWLLNSASIAKEIRLFDLGPVFIGRASHLRKTLRHQRMRIGRQRMVAELIGQAFAAGGVIAVFLSLVKSTLRHLLTLGDLVINLQALQRVIGIVQELIANSSQLYEHGLFMNRFYEFLALPERVCDPVIPKPFPPVAQQVICFENVVFQYSAAHRPVLTGVNLLIEPGQMVAFVGENGAGKSTLIKLLCRLYDPVEGKITIGGTDLKDFDRPSLWHHLSVLFQDFAQYQNTLAENIWFGAPQRDQSLEPIEAAAERGGAAAFARKFPKGYEQMLGLLAEGGTEISGGQWQKVALSRAFFRNASVIILDEPNSALDVQSEHDLFTRFKELTKGKTSVVISHRLSTVRMADRIFYLENGRITEAGDHTELMKLGGAYSELFETQAGKYR